MTGTCPETSKAQDFLDGALDPGETAAFRAHLAGCAECAAELAVYRRVFDALEATPSWDPGPVFTERVLARVLPSSVRRHRRLVALGWGYAGSLAAVLAGAAAWSARPGSAGVLVSLSSEALRRLLQTGVFMLNSLTHAVLRFAEGWGLVAAAGVRLSPLQRAAAALVARPEVALTLSAAVLVCAGVLWWMRPRPRPAVREVRHVSVLGF